MRWGRACAAVPVGISAALLLSACASEVDTEAAAVSPQQEPRPGPSAHYYQPGPADEVSPSGVHAEIVRWFSKAGYKDFQAEALAEHAKIESGFRPCASGAGLRYTYQWGGTRLRQLREFAQTSGCPQLKTQLAFTDKELRHEPKFSCFWGTAAEAAAYTALRRIFGLGSC